MASPALRRTRGKWLTHNQVMQSRLQTRVFLYQVTKWSQIDG